MLPRMQRYTQQTPSHQPAPHTWMLLTSAVGLRPKAVLAFSSSLVHEDCGAQGRWEKGLRERQRRDAVQYRYVSRWSTDARTGCRYGRMNRLWVLYAMRACP